jgi:uracil-DNA glycosylase family 4
MAEDLNQVIADLRERILYLKELGVESLDIPVGETGGDRPYAGEAVPGRSPVGETRETSSSTQSTRQYAPPPVSDLKYEVSGSEEQKTPKPASGSRLSSLPSLKERKPSKFFDKYNPRGEDGRHETGDGGAAASLVEVVSDHADITETVAEIHAEIGPACTRCKLSQLGRTQVVNSIGDPGAQLMFCGEAPGADEDRLGEPFVGRAGQLLTDIIEKGLETSRKDVFIGNINRCRPPGNRAPEEDECASCKPFLLREIAVVRPKVIVTLGATATQNLLATKTPIGKLRGRFHDFLGCKVMPTFHPAYLLRDPNKKREVWEDMKLVKEYLRKN